MSTHTYFALKYVKNTGYKKKVSKTREYSVAIFKQICESMLGHIFQRDMSWYYAQAEIFKKFPSLFRRQIETNKIGGSQTKTLINYAAPH